MLEEKNKNKERCDLRRKKIPKKDVILEEEEKLPEDASAVTRS